MDILRDGHDLRDTIVQVKRPEIQYRTTQSIKRKPIMTYAAQKPKILLNQKYHQTFVPGLIKLTSFVRDFDSKLHFM